MPKKGKQLSEKERARNAVIPELHAIYGEYLSESVIDMIAKQCGYELDLCISTLADMVHSAHADVAQSVTPGNKTPAPASAASSAHTSAAPSKSNTPIPQFSRPIASNITPPTSAFVNHASLPVSASVTAPIDSSAAAAPPPKKGIKFLSPRPSSELNRKQPASVWKNQAAAKPAPKSWNSGSNAIQDIGASSSVQDDANEHVDQQCEAEEEDPEAGYGSDANDADDVAALRPSADGLSYKYTGFENEIYFELDPSLHISEPAPFQVPTFDAVLDPESASARFYRPSRKGQLETMEEEEQHQGRQVSTASPAHVSHPLHALYLQLNSEQPDAPVQQKQKWSLFSTTQQPHLQPPSSAPSKMESHISENLTPQQALEYQRQQEQAERNQKKARNEWMKQHAVEKKNIRSQALQHTTPLEQQQQQQQQQLPDEETASTASPPADSFIDSDSDVLPTDIPTMAPLTRTESQASFERVKADPQELISLLNELFGADVELPVIQVVVESMLLVPSSTASSGEIRDIALECCQTLLGMVQEQESQAERDRAFAQELADEDTQQERQQTSKAGKGKKQPQSNTAEPFVASGTQLSDAEIAYRMSIDPNFDPNAAPAFDPNVGLTTPTVKHQQTKPVVKNKKGHVILDRSSFTPNFWAAPVRTGMIHNNAPTPDLSSSWKLAALEKAFPFAEKEVIEQTFESNGYSFDQAKSHLQLLYPNQMVDHTATPQPVDMPWSQKSTHHSKVTTTSRADAERGMNKDAALDRQQGGGWNHSAAAALTDELLEESLGAILDGRSSGGAAASSDSASSSSSNNDARAAASIHAQRRAAYFSAAIGAFTRGKGGLASEMAHKGRQEALALHTSQSRATLDVFRANNARTEGGKKIDLHGLHVGEALRVLEFALKRRTRQLAGNVSAGAGSTSNSTANEVNVVVGMGHHSAKGVGHTRLGPAVVEFLRKTGYAFSQPREGEIRVFVR